MAKKQQSLRGSFAILDILKYICVLPAGFTTGILVIISLAGSSGFSSVMLPGTLILAHLPIVVVLLVDDALFTHLKKKNQAGHTSSNEPKPKPEPKPAPVKAPSGDDIELLLFRIDTYLTQNPSTQQYRTYLKELRAHIARFRSKYLIAKEQLNNRFQETELSHARYGDFFDVTWDYILKNGNLFMSRMDVYDEEVYETELSRGNSSAVAKEYLRTHEEHLTAAHTLLEDVKALALRMERLAVELLKLNESEIRGDLLSEIDTLIDNTSYYREKGE